MSSNVPMVRDDALTPMTLEGLMTQAAMLVASGILPKDIKTPEAAAAIILTGRELGIPPMQAFRVIYIVNGKPTISTEHMAAMFLQAGMTYNIDKLDMDGCTITFKRPGMSYTHSFTKADAVKAKLWGVKTWAVYPKDMLYNRCFSSGARKFAPDVLGKMYTPEEIDPDSVTVDADGQTVVVTKPEPPSQTDQQKRDNAPPATRRARGSALPSPLRDGKPVDVGWNTWSTNMQKSFWAKANELNLSNDGVHHELGVANMKDYAESQDTARAILAILDYGINECAVGLQGIWAALGVDAVYKYNMTVDDAKAAIDAWAEAQDNGTPRQSTLDQAKAEVARIEARDAAEEPTSEFERTADYEEAMTQ